MSRTNKGSKGPGYEYWASRNKNYTTEGHPGRYSKTLTHREERRESKALTEELVEDGISWLEEKQYKNSDVYDLYPDNL